MQLVRCVPRGLCGGRAARRRASPLLADGRRVLALADVLTCWRAGVLTCCRAVVLSCCRAVCGRALWASVQASARCRASTTAAPLPRATGTGTTTIAFSARAPLCRGRRRERPCGPPAPRHVQVCASLPSTARRGRESAAGDRRYEDGACACTQRWRWGVEKVQSVSVYARCVCASGLTSGLARDAATLAAAPAGRTYGSGRASNARGGGGGGGGARVTADEAIGAAKSGFELLMDCLASADPGARAAPLFWLWLPPFAERPDSSCKALDQQSLRPACMRAHKGAHAVKQVPRCANAFLLSQLGNSHSTRTRARTRTHARSLARTHPRSLARSHPRTRRGAVGISGEIRRGEQEAARNCH